MRLIPVSTILFLFFTANSLSQDSSWQYSVDGNTTVALNTFSNNWKGKDAGTLIWVSKLNLGLKRQISKQINSETACNLAFGQTKLQDKKTKRWSAPEKSSDNINFQSVLRFNIGQFIDPFAAMNLWSQFLDNSNDTYQRHLNPLKLTESMGLARDIVKKNSLTWNARFGCALRQNYDRDILIPGDSINKDSYRTELVKDGGSELVSEFRYNREKSLVISGKLGIFAALFSSETQELIKNDFWRYPDINFESTLSFYLTRNLIFSYNYNIAYDREIDKNSRVKQTLGVGLGFGFCGK